MKRLDNPVIVILTADHLIDPVEKFQQTLVSAVKEARGYGSGSCGAWSGSQPGFMTLGKNKAKIYMKNEVPVRFDKGFHKKSKDL